MTQLDGNAVAGLLSEVYAFDVTLAVIRCAHCGQVDTLAQAHVFLTAMGAVIRCSYCVEILLVTVDHPEGLRISVTGATWLSAPTGVVKR